MYPPSGGMQSPGYQPNMAPPTSIFGNPNTFTAAANKQASDYDAIMKQYADLASGLGKTPYQPISYSPISPASAAYSQSADVTGSLAGLKDLATTGGYSAADIADIRARDIAPTRSIYAQGQQELERNRAISGGYSPSFNATMAAMSRGKAQQISDVTTAANAGIAQNVAANKIAAGGEYSQAAAAANQAQTQANQFNASLTQQAAMENAQLKVQMDEFNKQMGFATTGQQLAAIGGQASLYGTTPALTSTFGNQVMAATGAGQNQQRINQGWYGMGAGMQGPWGYS